MNKMWSHPSQRNFHCMPMRGGMMCAEGSPGRLRVKWHTRRLVAVMRSTVVNAMVATTLLDERTVPVLLPLRAEGDAADFSRAERGVALLPAAGAAEAGTACVGVLLDLPRTKSDKSP